MIIKAMIGRINSFKLHPKISSQQSFYILVYVFRTITVLQSFYIFEFLLYSKIFGSSFLKWYAVSEVCPGIKV